VSNPGGITPIGEAGSGECHDPDPWPAALWGGSRLNERLVELWRFMERLNAGRFALDLLPRPTDTGEPDQRHAESKGSRHARHTPRQTLNCRGTQGGIAVPVAISGRSRAGRGAVSSCPRSPALMRGRADERGTAVHQVPLRFRRSRTRPPHSGRLVSGPPVSWPAPRPARRGASAETRTQLDSTAYLFPPDGRCGPVRPRLHPAQSPYPGPRPTLAPNGAGSRT
jgi:hypothetical protein